MLVVPGHPCPETARMIDCSCCLRAAPESGFMGEKGMAMRRITIQMILIALIGALMGFGMMWVATDVLETSSLRLGADYSGAALVIYLLGAALGCWRRISWIFLAVVGLTVVLESDRFVSVGFWRNIGSAPAATIALWTACFVVGIILGRFVRSRSSRWCEPHVFLCFRCFGTLFSRNQGEQQ